ncbi:hypothetical protein BG844_17385 [Couchioplanes caeruleus subsp. caeruleus]|uniref:Uncharacterized protein n=1 Tax=Couchioplanes caeruleus subsp. caeruleus TaxID=56427 RepID=A0A1K0FJI5_9ACTN|nr:hypothetical protein BG844_17385 [Couchioplanes caeruleus subsp. caeruleus]
MPIWVIATLIWRTPVDCSPLAAAISWTGSEVRMMLGMMVSSRPPARSAVCLVVDSLLGELQTVIKPLGVLFSRL